MKYSIIINPQSEKSQATTHALYFIQALIQKKAQNVDVFFYGLAVESAFTQHQDWKEIAKQGIRLIACSTIAECYLSKKQNTVPYFSLAGLGQWMESAIEADKNIEFV